LVTVAPRLKTYHVTAIANSNLASTVVTTSGNHRITMDLPVKAGGGGSAAEPVEHLLAALCGCEAATAGFIARNMEPRVFIEGMEFEVRGERDENGAVGRPVDEDTAVPAMVQRVSGIAYLDTTASAKVLEVLERRTSERCPVADMMRRAGCIVEIKFVARRTITD